MPANANVRLYNFKDMEAAYDAGYSRATSEEYGSRVEDEDLTFPEFMHKKYNVPRTKTYLFTWIEVLPLDGRIVKEMYIHAQDSAKALEVFNAKVKTHLIIELKFNQLPIA